MADLLEQLKAALADRYAIDRERGITVKLWFESAATQQHTPQSDRTPVGLFDGRGHACRMDRHGHEP